jgi:hypothetical protein
LRVMVRVEKVLHQSQRKHHGEAEHHR